MVVVFCRVVRCGGGVGKYLLGLSCRVARLLRGLGDGFVVGVRFPGCECWLRVYASVWVSKAGCYLYLGKRLAPMLEEVWRAGSLVEVDLPISRDDFLSVLCGEGGCREPRRATV